MSKLEFKAQLDKYTDLLVEIKIEERRAAALPAATDNESITQRRARAGVHDTLNNLLDKEEKEYEALVKIINELPQVEQRQVLLARYMDGQCWPVIAATIFGQHEDFDQKKQSYLRRTYRIHGTALVNANKIFFQKREHQI